MASHSPDVQATSTKQDRKGLVTAGAGISIAIGAFILSSACCWAPALIVSLGLGSMFGAFMGVHLYVVAAGAALTAVGLLWHMQRRSRHKTDSNSSGECCS
ncbi:hypothetical protein D3C72_601850 [compost metagenome]|jgi:hypothetical protein